MVDDEVGEDKEIDPEIHCLGDTSPSPNLTQSAYEESTIEIQLNELSKWDKTNETQNKYNLRSKKKDGKPSTFDHPRKKNYAKVVASINKENMEQKIHSMIKSLVPEIKDILKSLSSFSFENEIQKIKVPVPFLELIKNE
jgi:hypothetical protein